jgi:APA family basic amino acid/polyamine antiporter
VAADSPPVTLVRRLGPFDAAAIVVSNVIGSGIFITPVFIAAMSPAPLAMLGVWAVGGALAFAGAMAYAELATLRPRAGGEYVYLREAFGPLVAFLTGWTSFVAGFSGAIAASAVGLASYLGRFIPAAGDATPLATLPLGPISLVVSSQAVVALAVIVGLSLVHLVGLGPGRLVQNSLATLKIAALVLFVVLGFAIGSGAAGNLTGGQSVVASSWVLALVPVMFSYSGWNAAAYVAEEIRDPHRNVPLALGIGTVAVVVIYLALNTLYLYAIPIQDLARLDRGVVDVTAERLFGYVAANGLAAFTIVSIAASISAMVLAGPRVYYAMARDGLFLAPAARVHPTFRTPALSILAQALWSGLLVLTGTFGGLVEYTGFAVVLFAGIAVMALFKLRWTHPNEARPFRAWGYPVAPGIFAIASLCIIGNALWRSPGPTWRGLAVILAGVPVYWLARRWGGHRTGA